MHQQFPGEDPQHPQAPEPPEAAPAPQAAGQSPAPTSPEQFPHHPQAPEQQQYPQEPGQAQPVWARPVAVRWVETEPLEYHQLLRGVPRYRWWKPLLGLVLGVIYYFTLSVLYSIAVMVPYMALTGFDFTDVDALTALALPDTQNPASILLTLGSVALMIPAALLAMLSVGLTPAKRLWSVALRIRWRWIWRTVLPALVALVVTNIVGIALEIAFAGGVEASDMAAEPIPGFSATAALWSLLLVVLLVPLQATAEELVFRGTFMQALGAWFGGVRGTGGLAAFLRGPWLPISIPAIAFGFAHIYDIWGWMFVVMLVLVAGWLSWRTGGLEAAITLHVVNNLIALSLMASGVSGETAQTESGGGLGSVLGGAAGFALYAWWVDRDFKRRDGRRSRVDVVELRGAAPVAAPEQLP